MKASIKFLSVLLIVTMCIGFMPSADAFYIGGTSPVSSQGTGASAAPEATADPESANAPDAAAGGEFSTALPGIHIEDETVVYDSFTVSTPAELRAAVEKVKAFGDIYVEDDILDLTYPLTISKSMTIHLNGHTLGFSSSKRQYGAAVVIESDVDHVAIENGTIELSVTTTNDGSFGYYNFIVSSADKLDLDVNLKGERLSGTIDPDEELDGIYIGDVTDPSRYLDDDNYIVTDNGDGTWTVTKKASAKKDPVEEPDEVLPSPVPDPEDGEGDEAEKGQEGDVTVEGSQDENLPKEVGTPEDLEAAALAGEAMVLTADVEVSSLNLGSDIDLAGHTLTVSGALLILDNGQSVTVSNGVVSGKISNPGILTLNGVQVGGGQSWFAAAYNAVTGNSSASISSTGSLTLTGGSQVGDVAISGGSFTVNDASVSVGNVVVSGSASINISGGTFKSLKAAKAVATDANSAKSIVGNVTGGIFTNGIEPVELFVNAEYTLGANNEIMPIDLTVEKDGVIAADGDGDLSSKTPYVVYYKGTAKGRTQPSFTFKFTGPDEGTLSFSSIDVQQSGETKATISTATGNYDYKTATPANSGGTLKLLTGSSELNNLAAGMYNFVFKFDGVKITNPAALNFNVFVAPNIETDEARYVLGSGDNVEYKVSDAPILVTEGTKDPKTNPHSTSDKLDAGNYRFSSGTLTLENTYLESKTPGTYYLGLWYADNVVVYVKLVVRKAPTATPSSANWTYNKDGKNDVTFTLQDGNEAEGVTHNDDDTSSVALTNRQYSISKDGKTVTIYASYLKDLVDTATGKGHGEHTFVIESLDGPVKVKINILPAIWPVSGGSYNDKGEYVYNRNSGKDLVFEASAPIDKSFIPKLNGTSIKEDDADGYTINGNKITFHAAFLKQRSINSFKLTVDTNEYGEVSTTFRIGGTGSSSGVQTGDENNALIWAAVLLLSGAAIVALMPRKKKQTQGK